MEDFKAAATRSRRAGGTTPPASRRTLPKSSHSNEYWTPALLLPSLLKNSATEAANSHPTSSETKAPTSKATSDASTNEIELGGNPMVTRI
ncbi:hypothetical protein Taro_044029, partial [Colocasia esculenta]|nr:hypothetical protein [Colocasia esculenta]